MSTPYYDIYINSVFSLAHTLVIHSSATATAMNNGILQNPALQAQGITVNQNDNTTWKYYMNLQGQYHPSDIPMSVVSLDTLQTIAFTVANLQTNRATARAYAFGSSYYNSLVAKYPTQENLIRGILNPVTLQKDSTGQFVIPEDGTILWYDPTLVESNEENLIPELQTWLYAVMDRWNVPAYTLADDLYAAAQLGMLFSMLPSKILNIRLANCKTRFVHSFHVREYLASNGGLDSYVDTLSTKQLLWLYRNIQYIKRNAGKQSTFHWLVDNIMTEAGLPLAEWNMGHDTSQMPTNLLPTVEFTRNPLNFGYSLVGKDSMSIEQMFDLEAGMAKDNLTVESDDIATATVKMENSPFNTLKTKVLESSVIDMTDASLYTLSDCLLNQWMYWAYSGRYRAVVNLTDPQTGIPFTMPVLDAFIAYLYAYNKVNGFTLVDVPPIVACHVQRIPSPSLSELQGIVDSAYISTNDLNTVLGNLPSIGIYISTDAFYDACLDIQTGIMAGRALYVAEEDLNVRAQMEIATQRCYCDVLLSLNGGSALTYDNWFQTKGYIWPNYSTDEWQDLANQLIQEATGIDLLNIRNLKDLQSSMLRLMAQLSSYSIQYIQSINTSTIKVIDWNALRVGNWNSSTADLIRDGLMASDVLEVKYSQTTFLSDDLYMGEGLDYAFNAELNESIALEIDTEPFVQGNFKYVDRYQMPVITFTVPDDVVLPLPDTALNLVSPDYVPLDLLSLAQGFNMDSLDAYSQLTEQDRTTLRNRFLGVLSTPISSALHNYILDGLNYPPEPEDDNPFNI